MSFWTGHRVFILKRRWARGERGSVIADALGCSRNMVLGKLRRLGLLGSCSKGELGRKVSAGMSASWERRRTAA